MDVPTDMTNHRPRRKPILVKGRKRPNYLSKSSADYKARAAKLKARSSEYAKRQRAKMKSLRAKAKREGRELTNGEILAAGIRPKGSNHADPWRALTASERAASIETSRLHAERQLAVGIPKDDIYGPYAVTAWGAKWDGDLTSTTNNRGR